MHRIQCSLDAENFPFIPDAIRTAFKSHPQIKFAELAVNSDPDILGYDLKSIQLENISTCVYIGKDDQSFFNLNVSLQGELPLPLRRNLISILTETSRFYCRKELVLVRSITTSEEFEKD